MISGFGNKTTNESEIVEAQNSSKKIEIFDTSINVNPGVPLKVTLQQLSEHLKRIQENFVVLQASNSLHLEGDMSSTNEKSDDSELHALLQNFSAEQANTVNLLTRLHKLLESGSMTGAQLHQFIYPQIRALSDHVLANEQKFGSFAAKYFASRNAQLADKDEEPSTATHGQEQEQRASLASSIELKKQVSATDTQQVQSMGCVSNDQSRCLTIYETRHAIAKSKQQWQSMKVLNQKTRRMNVQHQCLTCGKTFAKLQKVQLHVQTHLKERAHACNFCNIRFTTALGRDRHQ